MNMKKIFLALLVMTFGVSAYAGNHGRVGIGFVNKMVQTVYYSHDGSSGCGTYNSNSTCSSNGNLCEINQQTVMLSSCDNGSHTKKCILNIYLDEAHTEQIGYFKIKTSSNGSVEESCSGNGCNYSLLQKGYDDETDKTCQPNTGVKVITGYSIKP